MWAFAATAWAIDLPNAVRHSGNYTVRITVRDRDGATSSGSGIIVSDGWAFTCAHMFRDAAAPRATLHQADASWTGTPVVIDSKRDFAAIRLDRSVSVEPIKLGKPQEGEHLWAIGHPGGTGQAYWIQGRASYKYVNTLSWKGQAARSGHSGGPCFNKAGDLCGIISASDMVDETFFAPMSEVAESQQLPPGFIETQCSIGVCTPSPNGRYLFPWNSRANAAVNIARSGQRQLVPRQPCPPPIPAVPVPSARGPAGPAGPPGPQGPAGPPGVAGPQGDVAEITAEQLDEIASIIYERMQADPEQWRGPKGEQGMPGQAPPIEDIVGAIPPTRLTFLDGDGRPHATQSAVPGGEFRIPARTIEVINPDGTVQRASKPLGEPIRIRLVPVE